MTGAPPRLLRADARKGMPSPDGSRVAFISGDKSAIWIMGAHGGNPRRVLAGGNGDAFQRVFWLANPQRLAFERRHYSPSVDRPNRSLLRYYRQSYEVLALDTGKIVARVPNLWITSAAVLPDGRMFFLKWASPGVDSDPRQLWEVKTDFATGAFVGAPRRILPQAVQHGMEILGLSATADGKRAMVIGETAQTAVFVGDFDPSPLASRTFTA